ncbi:MAG: hydrolase 2, exosortase A system-associated [Pseudomonadota bacterium]
MSAESVDWQPHFLAGPQGALFALHVYPSERHVNTRGVIFCAPFAEELNKTRRTVRLAATALAAAGHEVLIVDLYGTGDSEGEFAAASWPGWVEDLQVAATWMREVRGLEHLVLWGLRTGAVLAVAAAEAAKAERLLLWQPVVKGKTFVTSFLRMRLVADRLAGDEVDGGQNTGELRELLAAGQRVEIGGYAFSGAMCESLDALDLVKVAPTVPVHWAEVVAAGERPFSPASRKLIGVWDAAGVWVEDEKVVGPSFWSTPEIAISHGLIDHCGELGKGWREARGSFGRPPIDMGSP